MAERKYRWGILAPGKMSAKFTEGLQLLDNVELHAVGSRDFLRAREFADEFGFRRSYGSYEELAADPEVEIIYIASPHSHHHEHTLLCLRNGKHVLCEKAFALNIREVDEMISEAKKRDLFLMEALWPPFQPFYKKAHEILQSGIPGRIIGMDARFSFMPPYDPDERKFNLELGGGSLLDIGIYPIIDALTFMGIPDEVTAVASFAETGSEKTINMIFRYNDGRMASLYSSFETSSGIGCNLFCEKGNISVERGRDMNQHVGLEMFGRESQDFIFTPPAMGYHWEAEEVMNCLDRGLKESPVVPLSFSRDLMITMDRVRKVAGITFPGRDW